jgi:hypothetical protein
MDVSRYYRDERRPDQETVVTPTWEQVEAAVRRMDNYCFPIVMLNTTDDEDDQTILVITGGDGRWALAHIMGDWQYEDPASTDESEVQLWDSDQGYFCQGQNVLTDVEKVLRIVRKFYDTGSYAELDAVV